MLKRYLQTKLKNLLDLHEDQFPAASNVQIGSGFILGRYRNIQVSPQAIVCIGNSVEFRKFINVVVVKQGYLNIGQQVFFNNYCSINCLGKITIGDYTQFGEGVKIYDHNHKHNFNGGALVVHKDDFTIGEVNIGKNCWIGSNVTILKGVTIGDNVIVGANNLVYKSIPGGSIVKAKAEITITSIGT